MNIQEIEARLAAIRSELETRAAELTAEQIAAYEKEVGELKEQKKALIDNAERRNKLLNDIAGGGIPAPVVRSFGGRKDNEEDRYDSAEYRRVFMRYVVRGTAIPAEYRSGDEVTKTSDVGAVIPTTTLNKIVEKLEAVGMILPLVTRTAYKGGVAIPTSSVKPVASWVNEGAGSDKQKKTVGSITFAYNKLRCAVAVSFEVDTMAYSAFEATLIANIVEAMTKAIEQAIISGDGSGKPKGILTETAPSGQTIEAASISIDTIKAAEEAIPLAYENKAVWCMTKKTYLAYAELRDSNDNKLGYTEIVGGKKVRYLNGRQCICCDYLPSFAVSLDDNTKYGFIFNFADYVLNTNYVMGIKKYEDNDTDDLVNKAVMLVDGKVVDKNSLVVLSKKA